MLQKCVLYDTTVGGLCLSFSFDYVTNTLLVWVGLKQKGATGTRGVSYMPERKNVPGDFPSLSIFVYPTANTEEGLTTWRDKCESMEIRKIGAVLRLFKSSVPPPSVLFPLPPFSSPHSHGPDLT